MLRAPNAPINRKNSRRYDKLALWHDDLEAMLRKKGDRKKNHGPTLLFSGKQSLNGCLFYLIKDFPSCSPFVFNYRRGKLGKVCIIFFCPFAYWMHKQVKMLSTLRGKFRFAKIFYHIILYGSWRLKTFTLINNSKFIVPNESIVKTLAQLVIYSGN